MARVESNIVFSPSASQYAESYSGANGGYIVSETGIMAALAPHLKGLHLLGHRPKLLEVAAGTGQATQRIINVLDYAGINNYDLLSTEYSRSMINAGKKVNESSDISVAKIPDLQAAAEYLPVQDGYFDAVFASQGIHWFKDIQGSLSEAYRVLMSGGMAVHAASGILEGYGDKHFTEHPSYKEYLKNVKVELMQKGFWRKESEEFEPKNRKNVNPFFHRYSVEDVKGMFEIAGFEDVQVIHYFHPVNKAEMLLRMSAGAASMFIFGGEYAKEISSEQRIEIVQNAITKLQREKSELLDDLDKNPTGEPVPVFIGKKPRVLVQQAA